MPVTKIEVTVDAFDWDQDVVNGHIESAMRDPHGNGAKTYLDADGDQDLDAIDEDVVELFRAHAVTNPWTDSATRVNNAFLRQSVTKASLYATIFPAGPGALNPMGLDPNEEKAMVALSNYAWGLTGPGRTGHVQTQLRDDGLILVEAKVGREPRRVATNNLTLVKNDLVAKRLMESATRNIDNTEKFLALIADRQPKMAYPLARFVKQELKAIVSRARHADPVWVRDRYEALEAGEAEADEFEDEEPVEASL